MTLATQAKGDYNALGTAAAGTYNGIASGTKTAYDNLELTSKERQKVHSWNVTTNVGLDQQRRLHPYSGYTERLRSGNCCGGSSFVPPMPFDVNNLAAQKFGQQQAMLAPYDAKALAELRANLAATGRTGWLLTPQGRLLALSWLHTICPKAPAMLGC